MDGKDMGLKLFNSSVDPPLCKGITFAIFHMSGNTPVENDKLIIWHRSTTMISNQMTQNQETLKKFFDHKWVKL